MSKDWSKNDRSSLEWRQRSSSRESSVEDQFKTPRKHQSFSPNKSRHWTGNERFSSQALHKDPKIHLPMPDPLPEYMESSLQPSNTLEAPQTHLLILDINKTLLFRKSSAHSTNPKPRPYLSTFLNYLASYDTVNGVRVPRFELVVYSSARLVNILRMLKALNVIPQATSIDIPAYQPNPRVDFLNQKLSPVYSTTVNRSPTSDNEELRYLDIVNAIWSRENLGLKPQDMNRNVEIPKDLSKVWNNRSTDSVKWGIKNSLIIDDEAFKASMQPYSHLPIDAYDLGENPSKVETDESLLGAIAQLETLRYQSNIGAFIRAGGLEESNAQSGREVCEKLGIKLRKEFTTEWRIVG